MTTLLFVAPFLALNAVPATLAGSEPSPESLTPTLLASLPVSVPTAVHFGAPVEPAPFVRIGPLLTAARPSAHEAVPDPFAGDPLLASSAVVLPPNLLEPPPPRSSPAPAAADDGFKMSYTFIELGYFSTDFDTLANTSNAWGGRAQLGLLGFLYLLVDYSKEKVGTPTGDIDTDSWDLGVGAHWDLTRDFNVVGEVSYLYDDITSLGSNSGWTGLVGARWLVLPIPKGGLELNGGYRYIDQDTLSGSGVSSGEFGARFHFLNAFSVGLGYTLIESDSRWGINARFSF